MVNRNDGTVNAVFVGGRLVFAEGQATDLVGKQRTGRFLRAAHKAPALSAPEAELASVS
jgi:N-acyl-D-aspartate/D-glutamate deacylase